MKVLYLFVVVCEVLKFLLNVSLYKLLNLTPVFCHSV